MASNISSTNTLLTNLTQKKNLNRFRKGDKTQINKHKKAFDIVYNHKLAQKILKKEK